MKEWQKEIIRDYGNRWTKRKLAEATGLGESTVYRFKKKEGISTAISDAARLIDDAFHEGLTVDEARKKLGFRYQRVYSRYGTLALKELDLL